MVFKSQQHHQQFLMSFFKMVENNFPKVKQVMEARNQYSLYSAIKVVDLWQQLSGHQLIVELGTGITTSLFLEYCLHRDTLFDVIGTSKLISVDENAQYQSEFKQILCDVYGQEIVDRHIIFIIRDVFKDDVNNECNYIFDERDKHMLRKCDFLYVDGPANNKLDNSTYICIDSVALTRDGFMSPSHIAFDIRHDSVMYLLFNNIDYKVELGNTFDGISNSNHHSIARRINNAV